MRYLALALVLTGCFDRVELEQRYAPHVVTKTPNGCELWRVLDQGRYVYWSTCGKTQYTQQEGKSSVEVHVP